MKNITEKEYNKVIIDYLNEMYGDFKEFKIDTFPDRVFLVKNKKVYVDYYETDHFLRCDFESIFYDMDTIFGLDEDNIRITLKEWLISKYGLPNDIKVFYGYLYKWYEAEPEIKPFL